MTFWTDEQELIAHAGANGALRCDECNRVLLGIEKPHELSLGDHPEDCWCEPTIIKVPPS